MDKYRALRYRFDADGLVFVAGYGHLFPMKPGVLPRSGRMTRSEYGQQVSFRATASLRRGVLWSLLLWAFTTHSAAAWQFPGDVNDSFTSYSRTLQLLGDSAIGSSGLILPIWDLTQTSGGPWRDGPWPGLRATTSEGLRPSWWGAQGQVMYSSGYPTDRLDGPIWQGKGLTAALDLGVGWQLGPLHVTLAPILYWSQNRPFELWPVGFEGQPSEAYPWRWIDWPQQQGPDPFLTVGAGQSEVAFRTRRVTIGLSTRNRRWGPGIQNSIVLGSSAAGFPHIFLSTSNPLESPVGRLEGQWLYGRLQRSRVFLPQESDPGRYATGLALVWSPKWISDLHVGSSAMAYAYAADGVFSDVNGDAESDYLGSLFFRWVLPRSGFELYGEWARNDRWEDIEDLLLEPEHSQGYTVGFQKAFGVGSEELLAVSVELTHLESENTSRLRDNPTFYAHWAVLEGYTHEGQLLGAVVGPGGNQQHLGLTRYSPVGSEAVWLRRRVRDNDALYAWAEQTDFDGCLYCAHDVTFEFGAELLRAYRGRELSVTTNLARQRNRWFEGPDVWHIGLAVRIRSLGGALAGGAAE